ncbi:uncharacterized protein LOC121387046 [Gigantopelta aegis]|uniref:uncharacterized protein LOC121387046 n=1 Tax=Gigantopelta aegis TaxID=1735272 RepID=UPI001B88BF68|nr:uncharacterized protein LOC121387046 [Gigantopelta aegis]
MDIPKGPVDLWYPKDAPKDVTTITVTYTDEAGTPTTDEVPVVIGGAVLKVNVPDGFTFKEIPNKPDVRVVKKETPTDGVVNVFGKPVDRVIITHVDKSDAHNVGVVACKKGCFLFDIMSTFPEETQPLDFNLDLQTAVITVDGELDTVRKIPHYTKVYVTTTDIPKGPVDLWFPKDVPKDLSTITVTYTDEAGTPTTNEVPVTIGGAVLKVNVPDGFTFKEIPNKPDVRVVKKETPKDGVVNEYGQPVDKVILTHIERIDALHVDVFVCKKGCVLVDIMSNVPEEKQPLDFSPETQTAVITVDGKLDTIKNIPYYAKVYVTTTDIYEGPVELWYPKHLPKDVTAITVTYTDETGTPTTTKVPVIHDGAILKVNIPDGFTFKEIPNKPDVRVVKQETLKDGVVDVFGKSS